MSVNKSIEMYTKLDKGLANYLKTIESCTSKIDEIKPAKDSNWIYENSLSMKECMDYVKNEPVKAKLFIGFSNGGGFYLNVHNREGKPVVAELSDFGSDRYSYESLFGHYFRAAEKLGSTVCYMNSENEYDAQFCYNGFDKNKKTIGKYITNDYGEYIGDKKAIDAYAKNELGLSVVGNIVRVPDVYLGIADKGFNRPMKGFVKKINRKEDFKLSNHYAIAYYDKDKKEYRKFGEVSIPLDIVVSKNFEKNLADVVQTEDFQNKLKESALCLGEYYKNVYDRKGSFEHNYDLKKNGYKLQEELENACNSVFFQDLKNQKPKQKEKEVLVAKAEEKSVEASAEVKPEQKTPKEVKVFCHPAGIRPMKDEANKTIGYIVPGYKDAKGNSFNVELPFEGHNISKLYAFPKDDPIYNYVACTFDSNDKLKAKNKNGEIEITVGSFKNFIKNRNRRIKNRLAKANEKDMGR